MTAETIIENFKKIPFEEQQKVAEFVATELMVSDPEVEQKADQEAVRRDQEIENGATRVLTHEEVFIGVRAKISS